MFDMRKLLRPYHGRTMAFAAFWRLLADMSAAHLEEIPAEFDRETLLEIMRTRAWIREDRDGNVTVAL